MDSNVEMVFLISYDIAVLPALLSFGSPLLALWRCPTATLPASTSTIRQISSPHLHQNIHSKHFNLLESNNFDIIPYRRSLSKARALFNISLGDSAPKLGVFGLCNNLYRCSVA